MMPRALAESAGVRTPARRGVPLFRFAALITSVLAILAPAVWNGFPFMFYDTGSFIEQAIQGGFVAERSAFYAWFLAVFRPSYSLWPATVAQVVLTVLVMAEFARVLAPGLSPWRFFAMIVILCLCTELPWLAGQVLPDILAPLLVLSLYLLGFHSVALGWLRRTGLIVVAVFAITAHASHLGLAAGLAITVAVLQVAMRSAATTPVSPRAALPALVVVLSLLLLVTSNFVRTGEVFLSRSGPAFVFGRLLQDGIAKRLLDDTCPGSGYRLCAYKDNLPNDANDYLWGWESPFQTMGRFEGTRVEAGSMIVESLKRYPWLHLKTAALNTLEQFVTFETGDGVEPLHEIPVPIMERHIPHQMKGYRASRQQNGLIEFDWINAVHVPVGGLSIVALAAILVAAARRRNWGDRVFLPGFLLSALLGNAFICGALSNPQDRYQSRLIWAASFAVLLLVAPRLRLAGLNATWAYARNAMRGLRRQPA